MGADRTFQIALDEDMAIIVDDAVVSGEYATTDDLVREALAEWWRNRTNSSENIARLKRAWDEGITSGPSTPVTDDWFEDIKRRGHARLEEQRAAK